VPRRLRRAPREFGKAHLVRARNTRQG
jgi:hypothetical protein